MIAVQNVSGQPQVIDGEGHVLGAGEFGAVEPDDRTNTLMEQGALAQFDQSEAAPEDLDPDAVAALQAATAPAEPVAEPADQSIDPDAETPAPDAAAPAATTGQEA